MKRKYNTTRDTTDTKVRLDKKLWYQFKLIFGYKGQFKDQAFTEAIQDYNEKNKEVLE